MEREILKEIILEHLGVFAKTEGFAERDVDTTFLLKGKEIVIISGVRRCGKSTLLKLLAKKVPEKKIYLDFEDIRLFSFTIDDMILVEDIAFELFNTKEIAYFFDEIQNVQLWERWLNNLYGKGLKVFVTGSNSKLLSSEIGTYITGRNKTITLYPLSFSEFLRLKQLPPGLGSEIMQKKSISAMFLDYFNNGGFPAIVKQDDIMLSRQYFDDILNRDVIRRYQIPERKEVFDLIVYLFSTVGSKYSYHALHTITGIKSFSTIKNYIECLKNVFLLYTIQSFDYSIRKQKVSSSKPYIIDNSFFKTVGFHFSENKGKRLENIVFVQLLRNGKEVYYHHKKKECDFIVKEGLQVTEAIQVAWNIDAPTIKDREIEGLLEAMAAYKLKKGYLLTFETEETIETNDKKISIMPVWKWLLETDNQKNGRY